jgi:hypothetical protein
MTRLNFNRKIAGVPTMLKNLPRHAPITGLAIALCSAIAATATPAQAGTLYGDWTYVTDSFTDGSDTSGRGGNAYEMYGMAFKQVGDDIFFAVNANTNRDGNAASSAKDGHIGFGDLMLSFANGSAFGINFASLNDSGSDDGLKVAVQTPIYKTRTIKVPDREEPVYSTRTVTTTTYDANGRPTLTRTRERYISGYKTIYRNETETYISGYKTTYENPTAQLANGLYSNVTTKDMTAVNNGYETMAQFVGSGSSAYGNSFGDVNPTTLGWYNQKRNAPTNIATGTFQGGVTFYDDILSLGLDFHGGLAADAAARGINNLNNPNATQANLGRNDVNTARLGTHTTVFSVKRTADMLGDFTATLLFECMNDGIALAAGVSAPQPPLEEASVPEPGTILGLATLGLAMTGVRRRRAL